MTGNLLRGAHRVGCGEDGGKEGHGRRGQHSGDRTPEEQQVHQTGVPTRLPNELTVMRRSRWVLATWGTGGEVGSI